MDFVFRAGVVFKVVYFIVSFSSKAASFSIKPLFVESECFMQTFQSQNIFQLNQKKKIFRLGGFGVKLMTFGLINDYNSQSKSL